MAVLVVSLVVKIVVSGNAHCTGCFNHDDLHDHRDRAFHDQVEVVPLVT